MDHSDGSGDEGSPGNHSEVDRLELSIESTPETAAISWAPRRGGLFTRSAVSRLCPQNRSNDILAGERFSPAENCNSRLYLRGFLASLSRDVDTSDPVVVCTLPQPSGQSRFPTLGIWPALSFQTVYQPRVKGSLRNRREPFFYGGRSLEKMLVLEFIQSSRNLFTGLPAALHSAG